MFDERFAWAWLAAAMAVALATILWMGRGTTFGADELSWLIQSPALTLEGALHPHDGHLILISRLVYKAMLEAFGTSYLPFRLLAASSVLLTVALFFVYLKRRVPAFVALAPCVVLLFFGSDWLHVLVGNAFTVLLAVSCGIGALLALERRDFRGDLVAGALLCLGILTYSVALAFIAGAALMLVLDRNRWRRIWVVAIPLVLYGAWFVWARRFGSAPGNQAQFSHLVLLPSWGFQALSRVFGALTGLEYSFPESGRSFQAGPTLAFLALIGLGFRLKRGRVPASLWAALAVLVAIWGLGVLTGGANRAPDSSRYLFPGAVVALLVMAGCAAGLRWSRAGLVALYVVAACGFAVNLFQLHEASANLRAYAVQVKAGFAGVDVAGGKARRHYEPASPAGQEGETPLKFVFRSVEDAGYQPGEAYIEAARRYGPLGYSLSQLRTSEDSLRAQADAMLVSALGLRLVPGRGIPARGGCRTVRAQADGDVEMRLTSPGASLRSPGGAAVQVQRFSREAWVEIGRLAPGRSAVLRLPRDRAPDPWRVSVATPSLRVCRLR